jgi:hypothetical protein
MIPSQLPHSGFEDLTDPIDVSLGELRIKRQGQASLAETKGLLHPLTHSMRDTLKSSLMMDRRVKVSFDLNFSLSEKVGQRIAVDGCNISYEEAKVRTIGGAVSRHFLSGVGMKRVESISVPHHSLASSLDAPVHYPEISQPYRGMKLAHPCRKPNVEGVFSSARVLTTIPQASKSLSQVSIHRRHNSTFNGSEHLRRAERESLTDSEGAEWPILVFSAEALRAIEVHRYPEVPADLEQRLDVWGKTVDGHAADRRGAGCDVPCHILRIESTGAG